MQTDKWIKWITLIAAVLAAILAEIDHLQLNTIAK